MSTIDQNVDAKRSKTNQELILGLTLDEEILQFNKECERLTGYIRDEVLHKKLSEILLPKESIELWKTLLKSIRQTMWVDDFAFPIKTKHDQIYIISWTCFLIKDEKNSNKDICLFGKPLKTEEIHKQSFDTLVATSIHPKEENKKLVVSKPTSQIQNEELSMKQKTKKIIFAREKEIKGEPISNNLQNFFAKLLEIIEKTVKKTSKKPDSMNKSYENLSPKYDTVIRSLGKSEKKDQQLEKNHKHYGKNIQHLDDRYGSYKRKQKNKNLNISFAEQPQKNTEFTFFPDSLGFKRQHSELVSRSQQMYIRASQFGTCETQLMNEGKMLNARVEEFYRRQELMKPKDVIRECTSVTNQGMISAKPEGTKSKEPVISDYHDILDKIPQSAAIVQRGILKQINSSFVTLFGYSMNEVVEKSFFDFISLDGLADVEKYYLDRLKGETVSTYKTVFSTKDNNKIQVEVNIKQTMYNGEKAEIAIITCLEKPETRLKHELAPKK